MSEELPRQDSGGVEDCGNETQWRWGLRMNEFQKDSKTCCKKCKWSKVFGEWKEKW